jgi:N6-L-threonylcarbamoyladenine synthase
MNILGIETSCDDSAAAVVGDGKRVLSSNVSSQYQFHAPFGGVVPEIAARQHLAVLAPLVSETLNQSGLKMSDIDAIAVTQGPGLIGSLLIGVTYAKGLASRMNKPLIPVDHVHAHVHGAILSMEEENKPLKFPCLALVASGGHCNLYYMKDELDFELIGLTVDDACGECFDKVAKMLGFGYPGGPVIEELASKGNADAYQMPRMIGQKDRLEFSYSGLKTHMVNSIRKIDKEPDLETKQNLCASFQKEALGQLVRKINQALKIKQDVNCILIAGGVAANNAFREKLQNSTKVPCFFPNLKYCSDNAAMVAAYGYHTLKKSSAQPLLDEWDAYSRYNFRKFMKNN